MSRLTRSRFAALVREHHAAVFAAARRILRRDADAQDVTQQVYLRALEQPEATAAAQEPRALLLTMARHLACNWLRDTGRRARQEDQMPMPEPLPDPATVAATADQHTHLRRELDALPDDLRVPLVLRFEQELSFAAVGAALEIAESTACERVQRGLVRLRERLTRAGLAGLALRIEEALALPAPVGVPAGLQAMLLGLFPATAAASSVALVLVFATLLGAAAWLGAPGSGRSEEPPLLATAATAPATSSLPAPDPGSAAQDPEFAGRRRELAPASAPGARGAAAQAAHVLAPARLEGRVQEVRRGPLAGWPVTAVSLEYKGKQPLFRVETRTDDAGRFALELPVIDAGGNAYHLHTRMPDEPRAPVYQHGTRISATAGAALPFLELVLGEEYVPRPGAWELLVDVRDAQGRAITGAAVALRTRAQPLRFADWTPEASAESDHAGRAILRGARLGGKALCVDARKQGHALRVLDVTLAEPGRTGLTVQVEPGVALTGRVRTVDGTKVSPNAGVRVVDETAGEPYDAHASIGADGAFEFRCLAPRPHRLEVVAEGRSPIRRRGVTPGGAPLELTLKAWDDPQDRGDHWGEIHGEVRDAITGKGVDVDFWDVEPHWLAPDEQPDLGRDFVPDLVHGRSAQKEAMGPLPDPSSRFHRVDLGPGAWLLEVRAPGHAPAFVGPIELAAGQLRAGIVVELRRGAEVRGVVRDAAGRPLEQAVVFLAGQGPRAERKIADQDEAVAASAGRSTIWLDGETRTDAQGRFVLPAVPGGIALRVVAVHPAWLPGASAARSFADGEQAEVGVRLVSTR